MRPVACAGDFKELGCGEIFLCGLAPFGGDIVAGIRNLTIMTGKNPGIRKQMFHFQLKYLRVNVEIPMHLIAFKHCRYLIRVVDIASHLSLH